MLLIRGIKTTKKGALIMNNLRTTDVVLLAKGGAIFDVTVYPGNDSTHDKDWWYCEFCIRTQKDPNTDNKLTKLLNSKGSVWRMRSLDNARRMLSTIFVDVEEIRLKLNYADDGQLVSMEG